VQPAWGIVRDAGRLELIAGCHCACNVPTRLRPSGAGFLGGAHLRWLKPLTRTPDSRGCRLGPMAPARNARPPARVGPSPNSPARQRVPPRRTRPVNLADAPPGSQLAAGASARAPRTRLSPRLRHGSRASRLAQKQVPMAGLRLCHEAATSTSWT
jgi:hypothetical protein